MPRGDVAGTGSGSERRACDHCICLFELWSQEIGGPGTSTYYRKTLTVALTEPEFAFQRYQPRTDWRDAIPRISCLPPASMAARSPMAFDHQTGRILEESYSRLHLSSCIADVSLLTVRRRTCHHSRYLRDRFMMT